MADKVEKLKLYVYILEPDQIVDNDEFHKNDG